MATRGLGRPGHARLAGPGCPRLGGRLGGRGNVERLAGRAVRGDPGRGLDRLRGDRLAASRALSMDQAGPLARPDPGRVQRRARGVLGVARHARPGRGGRAGPRPPCPLPRPPRPGGRGPRRFEGVRRERRVPGVQPARRPDDQERDLRAPQRPGPGGDGHRRVQHGRDDLEARPQEPPLARIEPGRAGIPRLDRRRASREMLPRHSPGRRPPARPPAAQDRPGQGRGARPGLPDHHGQGRDPGHRDERRGPLRPPTGGSSTSAATSPTSRPSSATRPS